MNNALKHMLHQLQLGEDLISAGADELFRRWQASTNAIGRLCTGAERWQATLRQMPVKGDLAEILRARTIP